MELTTEPVRVPGPRGVRASARAMRALLSEPCGALDALVATHGRVVGLAVGPARLVVVGDADLVGEVLAAPAERFRWRTAFRTLTIVTGPTAMMVSDGDDHRRRRRLAQPAFARRRLAAWAPLVVREVDRAIDDLPVGEPADLHEAMRAVVRRVVVRVLFGESLAGRADAIGAALAPAIAYAGSPALRQLPHPLPVGARAAARRARRRVDRLLDDEIARRRAASPTPGARADGGPGRDGPDGDGAERGRRGDVLDALLAAAADGGADDAEVRDQVVTLIAAGHDTTSAAISWLLTEVLLRPDVLARLRAEADAGSAGDRSPDDDGPGQLDPERLPYADAVVQESLRLHPAGPIAPRWVVQPLQLGPYAVPPRTALVWSPYLLGRDPDHWDGPMSFRPDRFLGTDGDGGPGASDAYLPFGAGPRKCIGFALAHLEMQLIAARVAQRLDATPSFTAVPPAVGMVTSRPSGGVPVVVTERRPGGRGPA